MPTWRERASPARSSAGRTSSKPGLNVDLTGAEIDETTLKWRAVPWEVTLNWREAKLSAGIESELKARYGARAPSELDVVMLMWEMPPLVAGGTWTACYHLVRRLHSRGARIEDRGAVDSGALTDSPFGVDVPIIDMGMEPPRYPGSATEPRAILLWVRRPGLFGPYGAGAFRGSGFFSAYGQAFSAYGQAFSSYGQDFSPYGGASGVGIYGAYGATPGSGSALYRLIGEFRRRVAAALVDLRPDIVHAHDWVTFDTARELARITGAHWVAHFHSTEDERQPGSVDELTKRIEQGALDAAHRVLVPSQVTKRAILQAYEADEDRIGVAPNLLSEGAPPIDQMGRFESQRVVFVGRLSRQKGVDRFVDLAKAAQRINPSLSFAVIGDGPEAQSVRTAGLPWAGGLPWERRGEAFREATAVVVPFPLRTVRDGDPGGHAASRPGVLSARGGRGRSSRERLEDRAGEHRRSRRRTPPHNRRPDDVGIRRAGAGRGDRGLSRSAVRGPGHRRLAGGGCDALARRLRAASYF